MGRLEPAARSEIIEIMVEASALDIASEPKAAIVAVRRVVALMNAGAGAFSQALAADVQSALVASFAHCGLAADIKFVDGEHLHEAAEAALALAERKELDAIVVGGGDGSLRTVASVLAGTGLPLGVLPLGTLNHFAKDLGIPLKVEEAAAAIAAGHTRIIDLAEVNGETFINNSSIGIYPYMVMHRERRRAAHKLAKWMAMVPAFLRMLHHFPPRRLRISAKGFARPYCTPCLFVGNNEYGMELFTFRRRHRLDAGELWFYVVKPRSPVEFFLMVCRMCFGHLDQARDLDMFHLSEAEVSAKTSRLFVSLDGEVRLIHTPLHYRSCPGALRVIVPQALKA
jgi:diacylglycerol kinase family enzyme